jgi:hypothetical protein
MKQPEERLHLQEAAVAAKDLKTIKLGHLQEAVRGKHDGVVGQVGVADAEVLLDALHSGCQIHGHAREGLGGRHLLLDALALLHKLCVRSARHLLHA